MTQKIKLLDTVETPWDVEIDKATYDQNINEPGVQVLKFQDKFYMHLVFKLPKGSVHDVPDGLATRLVDELSYAERVTE